MQKNAKLPLLALDYRFLRMHKQVDAGVLEVAYLDHGPPDGWVVVLMHGFPFDVHAYDEVWPLLVQRGARVLVPYLRGFGPTRFLSSGTMRSGQQAALGQDTVSFLDALDVRRAILAGYDWGGVASCVASALWPERVAGLVSLASYDINDISAQRASVGPSLEHALWYQHLFQTERGRDCLQQNRRELCRMLWRQWSPTWDFDDSTFLETAVSFDNPDFVDVVIHSYRFHFGLAQGDPKLAPLEDRLAARPKISVPAVTLDGRSDTLKPGGTAGQATMFAARHEHKIVDAGHNLPQEAPNAFADAVLVVRRWLIES